MSPTVLNREQSGEVDRRAVEEYGMSSLVLMENAGRGVVDRLFSLGIAGPVVVCCGRGNNAGDGFVIARHLDIRKAGVEVIMLAEPEDLSGDARTNYDILARTDVPIERLGRRYDGGELESLLPEGGWIVDAMLGTGAQGDPHPPYDDAIARINASTARKLSVDVPTGFNCDTGEPGNPTVQADHTCTFVASKPGYLVDGADRFTGVVHVLDIGAPRKLVEEILLAANPD